MQWNIATYVTRCTQKSVYSPFMQRLRLQTQHWYWKFVLTVPSHTVPLAHQNTKKVFEKKKKKKDGQRQE